MSKRILKNDPARYKASLFGEEVPAHCQGKEGPIARANSQGRQAENKMLVTVIIKQAGVYGTQQQFTVEINADSHLLQAVDHERENGEEATELVLNQIAKAVQSVVVSLVS